jgi:hypothetical protein
MAYLSKYPEAMPKPEVDEDFEALPNNKTGMAKWVVLGLKNGFDMSKGRNASWFAIAYEFGKCGYDLETTFEALEPMYTREVDFNEREWQATIRNGHTKALKKYWRKK